MIIPLRKKYTVYNGDDVDGGKVKKAYPQYSVARTHSGMGRRGGPKVVRPPDKVEQPLPKTMLVDGRTGSWVMISAEEASGWASI